jgi:hypothetical protein
MITESAHYPAGRTIAYGAIGGIIGGMVMYADMSGVMLSIGMGANCFAIIAGMITGQPYSSAMTTGTAMHFLTSIAIGGIFGLVVGVVRRLRITGYGKGIAFGLAAGLIAYAVLFLPVALTLMPPKMADLMSMMSSQMMNSSSTGGSNPNMMNEKSSGGTTMSNNKDQMMMEELPKLQSMILAGSLVSHIAYGIALGGVTTVLIRKTIPAMEAKKKNK